MVFRRLSLVPPLLVAVAVVAALTLALLQMAVLVAAVTALLVCLVLVRRVQRTLVVAVVVHMELAVLAVKVSLSSATAPTRAHDSSSRAEPSPPRARSLFTRSMTQVLW